MPKVKVYNIDQKERYRIVGELFELVANLKTKQEVINFLIGLFTQSENLMIARRVQIAKMLADEQSYDVIRRKLKVSHQTIATVERWLQNEEKRNFIIKKLREIGKQRNKNYSSGLLDKYAKHKALKNLFK